MRFDKLSIEKLITSMYIFINLYLGIMILKNQMYYGDFLYQPLKLNKEIVVLFILMNTLLFSGFYFLYKKIKIKLPLKRYSFSLNINKLNIFFLVIIIIQILFYLKTGIGKVGTIKNNNFSFIFNLFNLDCFFLFYYIIARKKNFLYIFNTLLCITYYLMRGWTGIFLYIFIIEGSLFLNKRNLSNIYIIFIVPILVLGGKIYQYLYILKFYIRRNMIFQVTFLDGINHLLERLSIISNSLMGFQNAELIKNLYLEQNLKYVEIISFFRPFTPSFLFDKNFKILNNLIISSVFGNSDNNSYVIGFISYIYNLYNIGIKELVLWTIFFLVVFLLYIKLVMFFIKATEKKELKILIYIYILELCNGGSLEMNNYGWPKIYFLILIFLIFGIVKVYRKNKKGEK